MLATFRVHEGRCWDQASGKASALSGRGRRGLRGQGSDQSHDRSRTPAVRPSVRREPSCRSEPQARATSAQGLASRMRRAVAALVTLFALCAVVGAMFVSTSANAANEPWASVHREVLAKAFIEAPNARPFATPRTSTPTPSMSDVGNNAQPPCRLLEPPDPSVLRMGEVVVSTGSWLAIGSPTSGDTAGDRGEVTFVELLLGDAPSASESQRVASAPCGSIVRTQRFQSSLGFDHFGAALALGRVRTAEGPTPLLLIGSDAAEVDGIAAGRVEVHFRAPSMRASASTQARGETDSGVWSQEAILLSAEPQEGAEFGAAIALAVGDPTVAAVGAPRFDAGDFFDAGSVEVFRRVPPSSQPRVPTDMSRGSAPHRESSIDNVRLASNLNAPSHARAASTTNPSRESDSKLASHAQWRSIATIPCPLPQMSSWFGRALAMNARWLAIGAPGVDLSGSSESVANTEVHAKFNGAHHAAFESAGAVFLYQLSNGQPLYVATLTAPDPNRSMWFGSALALDGDRLLVGAPGAESLDSVDPEFPARTGCAYLFDLSTREERPIRIEPPILESGASFGQAVTLGAGIMAIGAPGFDGDLELDATRGGAAEDATERTRFWQRDTESSMPIEDAGRVFVYQLPWAAWHGELEPPMHLIGPSRWPSALFGNTCAVLKSRANATPVIAAGHLYVEEESHAPSPGVTLHRIEQ